jgi:hypothetical protein
LVPGLNFIKPFFIIVTLLAELSGINTGKKTVDIVTVAVSGNLNIYKILNHNYVAMRFDACV